MFIKRRKNMPPQRGAVQEEIDNVLPSFTGT
jgi:hypothetical protein